MISAPRLLRRPVTFATRPPSDDQPFFFEFSKGVPGRHLALALVALLAFLGGVVFLQEPRPEGSAHVEPEVIAAFDEGTPWRMVLFAGGAALATGLAGPALVLRLLPLLGPAHVAGTLGTGVLLLSGAAASLLVQGIRLTALRAAVGWALLIGGLVLVAYREVLPLVTASLAGQPGAMRTGVALAMLVLVGFVAHITFPSIVRLAAAARRTTVVALLWGVTTGGTVLGSILGIIVAIRFGLGWSTLGAAVLFFVLFLVAGLRLLRFDLQPLVAQTTAPDDADHLFRRPPADGDEAMRRGGRSEML